MIEHDVCAAALGDEVDDHTGGMSRIRAGIEVEHQAPWRVPFMYLPQVNFMAVARALKEAPTWKQEQLAVWIVRVPSIFRPPARYFLGKNLKGAGRRAGQIYSWTYAKWIIMKLR